MNGHISPILEYLVDCLYFIDLQGILCIGFVKRARMKKEVSRDQAVKDLRVMHLLDMQHLL